MTIQHTIFRDTNGNKRAKITIEAIGALYAAYCQGARIGGEDALNFDAVLTHLKAAFGYRIQRKAKVPTVTCTFDGENELKAELMDAIAWAVTKGIVKYSRVRYMDALRRCTHHEFYIQFATRAVFADAEIELPYLLKCVKGSFNDHRRYTNLMAMSGAAMELCRRAEATTFSGYKLGVVSASSATCIYKAAAREVVAAHLQQHDTAFKLTEIRDGVVLHETKDGFHFQLDGKPVAPRDVFLMFYRRVPAMYTDLYGLLSYDMLLKSNKDILRRMVANWEWVQQRGTGE